MKDFILAWKEFKEDQEARVKAMHADPEHSELFNTVGFSCFDTYPLFVTPLKRKYKVIDISFENFMDWLSEGKQKFNGVIIKHEIK